MSFEEGTAETPPKLFDTGGTGDGVEPADDGLGAREGVAIDDCGKCQNQLTLCSMQP
jgi:hypothetical protein